MNLMNFKESKIKFNLEYINQKSNILLINTNESLNSLIKNELKLREYPLNERLFYLQSHKTTEKLCVCHDNFNSSEYIEAITHNRPYNLSTISVVSNINDINENITNKMDYIFTQINNLIRVYVKSEFKSYVYDNMISKIREFNFTFNKNPTILLIGKRSTGKTTLIRHIINILKPFNTLIVAPMNHLDEMFNNISHARIENKFNPDLTEQIISSKYHNKLIVHDDCFEDTRINKNETFRNLICDGRNMNTSHIFTIQYPLAISPEIRTNLDYVFIFGDDFMTNKKRLYEKYAGFFIKLDDFVKIYDHFTDIYTMGRGAFVVIDNTVHDNNISNKIFYGKIDINNLNANHESVNSESVCSNDQYADKESVDNESVDNESTHSSMPPLESYSESVCSNDQYADKESVDNESVDNESVDSESTHSSMPPLESSNDQYVDSKSIDSKSTHSSMPPLESSNDQYVDSKSIDSKSTHSSMPPLESDHEEIVYDEEYDKLEDLHILEIYDEEYDKLEDLHILEISNGKKTITLKYSETPHITINNYFK
jgi:energy-coupling factor transporter ATP-binding protein EcfA2